MHKRLLLFALVLISLLFAGGFALEAPGGASSPRKAAAKFMPLPFQDARPATLQAISLDSVLVWVEYTFGFGGSKQPWGAPGGVWDFDDYSSTYPWPPPTTTGCPGELTDPGDSLSWQGWTSVDLTENEEAYFHRDDMAGISTPLSGSYSMWCGTRAETVHYLGGPGYGNDWKQTLSKTFTLSNGDNLQFACRYDLESGYDLAYVEVRRSDGQLDTLGTFTGTGTLTPSYDLSAYWGMPSVDIVFHVVSDGAWSDEDGDYATQDGAFVLDDIHVGADFSDFEVDDDGWIAAVVPGVGDFTAVRDIASLPTPGLPNCLDKGVLTFFDSTTAGHPDGNYSMAISPVVVLDSLEVPSGGSWWIKADICADLPTSGGNYLTWRARYKPFPGYAPDLWGPWQSDAVYYYNEGPYCGPVAFDVSAFLPDTSGQVQIGLGVQNFCPEATFCSGGSGSGSTIPESPYVDEIAISKMVARTITYKDTTESGIANIDQDRRAICMAAAFANCFWYWDQNGYALVDHTNPDSVAENWYEDLKKTRGALKKKIYDEKKGHLGGFEYIHEKGQSYSARKKADPTDESGLYMHDVFGDEATYFWYWKELRRCQDVLLFAVWRDADGNEVGRHVVTGAGLIDSKDRIIVSNSWGPPRDNRANPVDKDNYDSYAISPVGTDKTAPIVITDARFIHAIAGEGVQEIDEITVEQITAISPGPPPKGVKGQVSTGGKRSTGKAAGVSDPGGDPSSAAASMVFDYTISNDDSVEVFGFFVNFAAPYTSVTSPPGWSWVALPGYAPWNNGDDRFYYDFDGVYWYTNSIPIAALDSLPGFAIVSFDTVSYDSAAAFYGVSGDSSASHTYGFTIGPPSAVPTGVRDTQAGPGFTMALEQSWPNPFNPTTSIRFTIPERGHVRLSIYNVAGQRIRTLLDEVLERGIRTVVWDARSGGGNKVASGVYFYRLEYGGRYLTRKAVLLK